MKKILVVFLALLVSFSTISCGRRGEKVDKTKTQLYVATFDGGFGSSWMEAVETRFEAKYANVSFENGKKGVQIIAKPERALTNETLVAKLSGMKQDVIFTEAVSYYELQSRGLFYDITDAVTKPINYDFVTGKIDENDPETKSIQEKMTNSAHKDYFADNGKYYGLPFYEATYGIVYDINLFEEYKLYFAADGNFIKKSDQKRSNGPDGKTGVEGGVDYSADDGLPATYEEFFKLCDYMADVKGITPITWNGVSAAYVNALVESLQCDYEGEEQMRLNYTANGTANSLVKKINGDGSIELEAPTAITAENGYLTWTKQAGKYYGLKFAEQLIKNEKYYDKGKVASTGYMQTDAQNALIMDRHIDGKKPVAMLIDGSWWLNESKSSFEAASKRFGEQASLKGSKYGLMPLPKATANEVGEKYSLMEVNSSICFVNGNIDKKKDALVKEFIQFCHTEESLREFTSITYTTKPFAYEMTQEQVNAMPYWGQEMYRLHNEAAYVSSYSTSAIYKKNASKFTEIWQGVMFKTTIGSTSYKVVPDAMLSFDGKAGVTAKDYFEGLAVALDSAEWNKNFIPKS